MCWRMFVYELFNELASSGYYDSVISLRWTKKFQQSRFLMQKLKDVGEEDELTVAPGRRNLRAY